MHRRAAKVDPCVTDKRSREELDARPRPDRAGTRARGWPRRGGSHRLGIERAGQHGLGDRRRHARGRRHDCRGPAAARLVFSPDYSMLYICASDSDAVQVLDVATRTIVADLPSGADPEFFDLDPTAATSTSPTRTMRSPPWSTPPSAGWWRRSRSGSSRRAWRSAMTATGRSRPPRPRTWSIGSTPRPMRSSPTPWSASARATPGSPPTTSGSG